MWNACVEVFYFVMRFYWLLQIRKEGTAHIFLHASIQHIAYIYVKKIIILLHLSPRKTVTNFVRATFWLYL